MLALDSLVTDLMFFHEAPLDQQMLIDPFGGPEKAKEKKLLDPDMLDPRMEMEMSPSVPFRRRGERRLMIIDDAAPLRADPQDPIVQVDLRPAKDELIRMCDALPVRLGRLFALGAWGDAVLVARLARDLRAICLLGWALDPTIDVDGRRRASQLSRNEFETKLLAFEKRLDELSEDEILARLGGDVHFERRGDLLIVDVLEADGTWDQRKSVTMEMQLAALDRFSMLPGAPSVQVASGAIDVVDQSGAPKLAMGTQQLSKAEIEAEEKASSDKKAADRAAADQAAADQAAADQAAAEAKAATPAPPLSTGEIAGGVVLVFPADRLSPDAVAALGKRDWDHVVRATDKLPGSVRDRMQRDGAAWVAPLEFLSEVFLDGKPLTKPAFEAGARPLDGGARALDVHFPRFGPVTLLDVPGRGRFVTSLVGHDAEVAALVAR
jgi:hypothetical protein